MPPLERLQPHEAPLQRHRLPRLHRASVRRGAYTGAVPIYEYACMECEAHFEELVRSEGQAVLCPECEGANVLKQLSAFAIAGSSAAGVAASGGGTRSGGCCGGGCCG